MKKYFAYKQKLFVYFFILFSIFTISVLGFQYDREKTFKIDKLESDLDIYNHLISSVITEDCGGKIVDSKINNLINHLPVKNLRLTVIDVRGRVLYDNEYGNSESMENHLRRPEVMISLQKDYGADIRYSTSMKKDFYYYCKYYGDFYIRVALPYDMTIKNLLKANNLFLYFLLLVFIVATLTLVYISDKLGKSLSRLKDFAIRVDNKTYDIKENIQFPNNELGVISNRIISLYNSLHITSQQLEMERDKMNQHFKYSLNGLAIFDENKSSLFANSRFIQYMNVLMDTVTVDAEKIFSHDIFKDLNTFIEENTRTYNIPVEVPRFQSTLRSNGRIFMLNAIIFEDKSFEIALRDISEIEKNRILKQEMSSNIAHELRTPVTSIRGYLETIIETENLPEETKQSFIDKSFKQIMRLSELINDISLISKMEDSSTSLELIHVNLKNIVDKAIQDGITSAPTDARIESEVNIPEDLEIEGNPTLLYLLFKNLIDNSIKYVDGDININIKKYHEDDNFHYFSFKDNGNGVDEEHLNRLFERFYRVDTGRTREKGGTGLGLSIVKNAVIFHGGDINVKNANEGGLEFIFTIKK
ncbi:two-component sensor histidine kinase [Marinilabiliaceae bacterium JC040]|nr:two-component sensor histidine kinase [Marinilabiliaceae bacterium JC040]